MKNIDLTEEQLEKMSYTDVADLVLKAKGKKMTIQDLFSQVIKIMNLPNSVFESKIGDFFRLLSTDKRFIMLDKGFWDLRDNHVNKVVIDDDEEEVIADEIEEDELEEEEIIYDEDTVDDDPEEDDYKDFVVVDEEELEEM